MLTVLSVLAVLAVLFIAAAVATREGPILADAPADVADLGLPDGPLQPEDLQAVRFGLAVRGYRMAEVDAVLDRVVRELSDRDKHLAASTRKPDPASVPVIPVTVKSASEPEVPVKPTGPSPPVVPIDPPLDSPPPPPEDESREIPGQVAIDEVTGADDDEPAAPEEAAVAAPATDDDATAGKPADAVGDEKPKQDAVDDAPSVDVAAPSIQIAVVPTEIAAIPVTAAGYAGDGPSAGVSEGRAAD